MSRPKIEWRCDSCKKVVSRGDNFRFEKHLDEKHGGSTGAATRFVITK